MGSERLVVWSILFDQLEVQVWSQLLEMHRCIVGKGAGGDICGLGGSWLEIVIVEALGAEGD